MIVSAQRRKEDGKIEKIRNWYKNLNINRKFTVAFILVIMILVTMILIITNSVLYVSGVQKAKITAADECEIIQVRLESMRENLVTCANMITQDINRIYHESNGADLNKMSFISVKNNIYTVLDYDKRCFKDIDSILFIDKQQNMSYTGLSTEPSSQAIMEELVSQIPDKGLAEPIQFPMEKREYFHNLEPVLTIGKRIINMETGKVIGHIFINVRESKIASIFPDNEDRSVNREFFLVDEKNRVTVARNKEILLNTVDDKKLLGYMSANIEEGELIGGESTYLITGRKIPLLEWTLISRISIKEMTADIRITSGITILLGILGILAAAWLTVYISERITKPIHELTDAAKQIEKGNFDVNYIAASGDEIGILSKAFQTMAKKIFLLMEQIKKEQEQKRESELALLQSQIKPHFLYNSLDLIYIFCDSNMAAQGAKVAKSLADFYRTSLSSGKEIITIEEEMKNIENYLYIQRERYYDTLDFTIESDPAVRKYTIVKLTLQPLVENAIYHGLKQMEEKGNIKISGYLKDEWIVLSVEDDGVGMDMEKIKRVLAIEEEEYHKHFGLKSVEKRLRLYYGKNFEMKVVSKQGEGTKIEVWIPRRGDLQ